MVEEGKTDESTRKEHPAPGPLVRPGAASGDTERCHPGCPFNPHYDKCTFAALLPTIKLPYRGRRFRACGRVR